MMNYQRLSISMILIVLSLVYINASPYQRQNTNNQCPTINFCEYIQCANGQCIDDKTLIDCYRCACNGGFTGKLCDTPIVTPTSCNPPCQNNGQCQQTAPNTSTCVCTPDYTGAQCETSVLAGHICVTMPSSVCQNGGTCTINGAGFICNCPMQWTGTNCEIQDTTTVCSPTTCSGHGSCQQAILPNNVHTVFCTCDAQWTGKYCTDNLANNCPTNFCQSGGTCQMNGNTPYCLCPSTHTGQQCETLISTITPTITTSTGMTTTTSFTTARPGSGSCTSSPCLNGGSCFNTGNNFICLCTAQYSGPTCSVPSSATTPAATTASNTNACSPNPCSNGGSCYKHANGFVCVCTTQYAGPTCAMAKTTPTPSITTPSTGITCANQPCQNGGICYSTSSSYFCYCGANSNYSGKNCDTPNVPALPSCPLNCAPGYCVLAGSGSDAYACMCQGVLTPTSCSSK